jgi:hypothetical protein
VLYSPTGVYAATLGLLDSSWLEELAGTGVELVQVQQRGA